VTTTPDVLNDVREALEAEGMTVESGEIAQIPQTYVDADGSQAKQVMRLMDAIDEHDDVQQVWSNFDIPEEMLEDE